MLIVLPPSEGKTAPAAGAPVELASLAYAEELTARRERVLAALVRTSAGRQRGRALKALGLSAGQAGELERNAGLETAPAGPAAEVYTGGWSSTCARAATPPRGGRGTRPSWACAASPR